MKKLLGIVVLGLLWCNVGFAKPVLLECLDDEPVYPDQVRRKGFPHVSKTFHDIKDARKFARTVESQI
jgi:hypothetical protein